MSGENTLPGLRMAIFSLYSHLGRKCREQKLYVYFYKGIDHIHGGSPYILITSQGSNTFIITLGVISTYEFVEINTKFIAKGYKYTLYGQENRGKYGMIK